MALRACDGVRVMSVTFLPHSCYLLMSEIRLLESPTFLTALPIYMYLYLVAYLSVKLQYNVHAIGSPVEKTLLISTEITPIPRK